MGFITEFKQFAVKGNVIDLAVGVIIGAAFGKIVDSIVNDLIMPLASAIIGSPDFSKLYVVLKGNVPKGSALDVARKIDGSIIFAYGNFLTVAVNFLLLALLVFLLVKAVNKLKAKNEAVVVTTPPAPSSTDKLLAEIRDTLRANQS